MYAPSTCFDIYKAVIREVYTSTANSVKDVHM